MQASEKEVQPRVSLITGAAAGIGRHLAQDLLAAGQRLILVDRDLEGLQSLVEPFPGRSTLIQHDFLQDTGLEEQVSAAIETQGRLSGLIHVAGLSNTLPLKALSRIDLERVMAVNTFAAFDLVKHCCKARHHAPGMSVVFVSSVYSLVGSAANSAYAMSKAALNGLARSLAIEFAPRRLRFNCVAPGFIKTEMLDALVQRMGPDYLAELERLHPLGLGSTQDVSNAIQFLLSDQARWITGSVMSVDGGFTAQ
ncbi:MAG: SDR family oxidoreductase [Curvibacter sp.]|nr:MAG: SDR family oxidoreductase [Curvibacter sp.]